MLRPLPPLQLRPLQVTDLADVLDIERASLPTPASLSTYRYELVENRLAHYQALLFGEEHLVGYAGYWIIADEIHISIIAVSPPCRGRGYGELLLLNILHLAYEHRALLVTLEVRESNHAAQALYQKYQFDIVGRRRKYYKDSGEDALLMTILLDAPDFAVKLQSWQETLFEKLSQIDSIHCEDKA